MKPGIAVNAARCMACYACFMACKDEHCGWASKLSAPQPHMGQYWMNIVEWERGDNERRIKTATVPTPCSHCAKPACMAAAKDGAVYKREDGIVIIDPEKAKGQKQIVDACPIHAIYWNEELQLPQKCTMCAELMDDPDYPGKEPRCAIGQIGQLEYMLVMVSGRGDNNSDGCTMATLAQYMQEQGCQQAYNLDGGISTQLLFLGRRINNTSRGPEDNRKLVDIVKNGQFVVTSVSANSLGGNDSTVTPSATTGTSNNAANSLM